LGEVAPISHLPCVGRDPLSFSLDRKRNKKIKPCGIELRSLLLKHLYLLDLKSSGMGAVVGVLGEPGGIIGGIC